MNGSTFLKLGQYQFKKFDNKRTYGQIQDGVIGLDILLESNILSRLNISADGKTYDASLVYVDTIKSTTSLGVISNIYLSKKVNIGASTGLVLESVLNNVPRASIKSASSVKSEAYKTFILNSSSTIKSIVTLDVNSLKHITPESVSSTSSELDLILKFIDYTRDKRIISYFEIQKLYDVELKMDWFNPK